MGAFNGSTKMKIFIGDVKVKKAYLGSTKVYSSGNVVTYNVDGATYQEEVDEGASVLNPTTFTPTKSGWTFVGWREDATASSSVLSSKIMGDTPITLYAVFRQTVLLEYYDYSTVAKRNTGNRYYNNGNVINPSFTLTQTIVSGWTARGWSTGTAGDSGIVYNNGATFSIESNTRLYGMYYQTVTVTYYTVSDAAKKTASGIRYYNSNGNVTNPRFTIAPAGYGAEWTFRGWTTSTAANAGVTYANINNTEIASNVTLYILLQLTVTLKTVVRGATSSHTSTLYLNSYGANTVLAPRFTVVNPTISGMTFRGWSTSASSTTVSYNSISNLELYGDTTLYAVATYPDATTIEYMCLNYQNVDIWGGTLKTYLSNVDASKYSGMLFKYNMVDFQTAFKDSWGAMYVSDGTNKTEIAYSTNNGSEITIHRKNLTPTLTFAKSSGTASVMLTTESSGTLQSMHVLGDEYTLIGRTVVG